MNKKPPAVARSLFTLLIGAENRYSLLNNVDEEYAGKTFFETRVAHGMLTASFISTIVGTMLPGPGSIYVSQEVNFLAPVKIGDTITTTAEVTELLSEEKRVRLKTYCTNQDGTVVIDGQAVVSPPRP